MADRSIDSPCLGWTSEKSGPCIALKSANGVRKSREEVQLFFSHIYISKSEKILKPFSATLLTVCRGIKMKLGVYFFIHLHAIKCLLDMTKLITISNSATYTIYSDEKWWKLKRNTQVLDIICNSLHCFREEKIASILAGHLALKKGKQPFDWES